MLFMCSTIANIVAADAVDNIVEVACDRMKGDKLKNKLYPRSELFVIKINSLNLSRKPLACRRHRVDQ